MFSFLKSIKPPFNKKIITCLSILAVVLAILYISGLTKYRTKPIWESYEDAPAEDKNAIDKVADAAKALFGV